MGIFKKPAIRAQEKKTDMPEGLWEKCPACGEVTHKLALAENQQVCPKCDHHFTQTARDRLGHLLDPESFLEQDADMVCFIYRDEVYNKDSEDKGIAELIVAKHRAGETDTIRLAWLPEYTLFANLAQNSPGTPIISMRIDKGGPPT